MSNNCLPDSTTNIFGCVLSELQSEDTYRYSADALFTLLVVLPSVIIIFRGIWNVYDVLIFPDDVILSDVASFIGGYILMLALLALQPILSRISANLDLRPMAYKVIFEDVIMIIATWSNVLLWRGGWNLCLRYVIPEPELGSWVCHVTGTVVLIGLQVWI